MSTGTIKKVAGPLVVASGMRDANMFDVVRVSDQRLIGEIIEIHGDEASIQVYEETSGLGPGEPVVSTDAPLSVELGPGLIGSIYDGIQRPLEKIMEKSGNNLTRGIEVPALDREKTWTFVPTVEVGDEVEGGDIIGTVKETNIVEQRILVPNGIKGKIAEIGNGEYTVEDTVCVVEQEDGTRSRYACFRSGLFVADVLTSRSCHLQCLLSQDRELSIHSSLSQRVVQQLFRDRSVQERQLHSISLLNGQRQT